MNVITKMMRSASPLWTAATLLALVSIARPQQVGVARGLAQPHHQLRLQTVASDGGFRYWDKGYLLAWSQNGSSSVSPNAPAVMMYDQDGNEKSAYVWFEGAARVGVASAAITSSGKLVVSGGMRTPDGIVAFYIAEIGEDGRMTRVIRTSPFVPVYICGGQDNTVWSYGFERDENGRRVESGPMLRQFSFENGQLQAMLSFSNLDPEWRLPEGKYPGEVSMRCNADRVVIYNGRASQWVQFDLTTKALSIRQVDPLPPPSKLRITGFAMTDDGDVFASFHERSKTIPMSGLFQLTFEAVGAGTWTPVPGTVGPYLRGSPIARLIGTDGRSLIHTRAQKGELYWSRYEKR
jgi:hypothetical protein